MNSRRFCMIASSMLALSNPAGATRPTVYLFGTVSGTSGFGEAGSQCTYESLGNSTIAFDTKPDGKILMTGFLLDHQDRADLVHSTYYGVASFTPTSPEITFEKFDSTNGGLHYPIFMHGYRQTKDEKGNVHIHMRLKLNQCLMVIDAVYRPLGGTPIFP